MKTLCASYTQCTMSEKMDCAVTNEKSVINLHDVRIVETKHQSHLRDRSSTINKQENSLSQKTLC